MKLNKFLLAVLAAASLTACSDSTDVEKGNGAQWNSDGTGYVSLSLNLPTTKSTGMRATGSNNDQFEDGTADEYKVNDVMLILFQGANEADANFVAAYKLSNVFDKESTSDNNITATSKLTRKIKAIDNTTSKLYAYVAINSTGVLSTTNAGADDIENTSLNIIGLDGSSTAFSGNFTDFLQQTTKSGNASANFLMGNAPLADASGNVHTLSTIDASMIKNSAAEAAKAPAAEVYVERAVAKVTLGGSTDGTINNIAASAPKWTITGWTLDNTRTNTQIVRNVQGFSTWNAYTTNEGRFKGTTAVDAGGKYLRTYWAYDGSGAYTLWNDDPTATNDAFKRLNETEVRDKISDSQYKISNPQYCFENTFDVANMTYKNTTRALVKVHIGETTDTENKFMYNEDYATYANLSDINNILAAKIKGLTAVEAVNTTNANITDITFDYYAHKNDGTTVAKSDAKYYVLKSFKINDKTYDNSAADPDKALFQLVRDYFGRISIYRGGDCYYQILIKHFGDDLTPWSGNNTQNTPTTGIIYPGGDAAFLGRYGVLRNNWYNLSITGVNKIGTPDITVPDNTPDDNLDSYISVKINVLSWAKRQQDVILQ